MADESQWDKEHWRQLMVARALNPRTPKSMLQRFLDDSKAD